MNNNMLEKVVKGVIIAGGTLLGMAVAAFVKQNDAIELGADNVEVTDEAFVERVEVERI